MSELKVVTIRSTGSKGRYHINGASFYRLTRNKGNGKLTWNLDSDIKEIKTRTTLSDKFKKEVQTWSANNGYLFAFYIRQNQDILWEWSTYTPELQQAILGFLTPEESKKLAIEKLGV